MAKETYQVAELSDKVLQYLTDVRRTEGRTLAGIYMSNGVPIGTWGFPLLGAGLIIGAFAFVIPPLNHPTHQAMLLTAGLMMGGWMLIAGLRILSGLANGTNLGEFTYADPKQIWIVNNSVVYRYPLNTLRAIYANGQTLTLEYSDGSIQVGVPFEVGILEIVAYVDYWLKVRAGGAIDQALIEAHAANARAMAYDQTPNAQGILSFDIPVPIRSEAPMKRPVDWPILAGIAVGGVALFFVTHWLVLRWHDDAVYDAVRSQSPHHWRVYLLDDRNVRHRDEIQTLLRTRYSDKAGQLKPLILAKNAPAFKGTEDAMAKLLLALADAPQALVTLRIKDATEAKVRAQIPALPSAPQLVSRAHIELTDSLYSAIGQDLITLAQPPDEVPAWIDIQYHFKSAADTHMLEWTLAIRTDPDSEPIYRTAWASEYLPLANHPESVFNKDLNRIKVALAGDAPP